MLARHPRRTSSHRRVIPASWSPRRPRVTRRNRSPAAGVGTEPSDCGNIHPWFGKTRIATAIAVLIFATAVNGPAATTQPLPRAKETQAEIQIGLCAPADQIVRALELRPRGTPIEVWLFDDAALTLFGRGLRLRLRVAADGRSEFTLKVADQDCARLDPNLVPPGEGKCEIDLHGASMAGAVSLARKLDRHEHKRPPCGSRSAGAGVEPIAEQVLARSRRRLAVAARNSCARSDASPDLSVPRATFTTSIYRNFRTASSTPRSRAKCRQPTQLKRRRSWNEICPEPDSRFAPINLRKL